MGSSKHIDLQFFCWQINLDKNSIKNTRMEGSLDDYFEDLSRKGGKILLFLTFLV